MCFRKVFNDLATNYRSVSWERIINESIEETRSVRGDQDPNGIVSNREERILEEVQLAEKSNIYIAYNGDQWNCNLPITITIADVKVKPMGRLFKATGVPSGRQRYTIQGIINCPAIGSCVVKGSGFIEVEENAKYYVVWKIISQGRCNAYLTR
jgi:hypothetical protein